MSGLSGWDWMERGEGNPGIAGWDCQSVPTDSLHAETGHVNEHT